MMDYLTDFWIAIYAETEKHIHIDRIHIWEDMSGKAGPLISPAMFREFMTPNYRKIVSFAKNKGIPIVSVDTDGHMDIMMEVLSEAGINWVEPFEVRAGCDIVKYRRAYPDISLYGGIDKQALTTTKAAIDAEIARIDPILHDAGYFPALDHLVHPEISYENFLYFVGKMKAVLGF